MGGSSKKVTVGYKYYLGMHMILCHGPVDRMKWFKVDDRVAWLGSNTGGQVNVQAEGLFGGESREGGVSGLVDVEFGKPTQGRNSYLQARLGSEIPAFRGVLGVVLRQCYLGINPYLKKWAFRAQRIHTRQNGIAQWYDAKAEIGGDLAQIVDSWQYQTASNALPPPEIPSAGWSNGTSPFGRIGPSSSFVPTYPINTLWPHDTGLWMRKTITCTGLLPVYIYGQVENACFVYWDGALIGSVNPTNTDATTPIYMDFAIPTSLATAGDHTLAIFALDDFEAYGNSDNTYIYCVVDQHKDMNPAHIIRECLTDPDWGMGYAEADIDETSFAAAADTLWDEKMGISLIWDRQVPIESFITEIIKHIDAALYVDRITGKFVLKLIRADYDPDAVLELGPGNVEKIDNPSRPTFGELTNSVTVNYWSAETGKDASITVEDIALIQQQGAVINTTVQYPGFTNFTIASLVGLRDLRTLSSPLFTGTIYANTDAKDLNIGDVFKLTWPDYELDGVLMRVTGLALGDGKSNKVRINATQDQFATPTVGVITNPGDGWVEPGGPPTAAAERIVQEAPYYELVQTLGQSSIDTNLATDPSVGYVFGAVAPVDAAINATLSTDAGSGYEDVGIIDFCPVAELSADVGAADTAWTVTNGENLDQVALGTHFQIDDELCVVTALDVGTGAMTVGRGVLDTSPRPHSAAARLYFWDVYNDADPTQYVDGETINVKIRPTTGQGTLALSDAPVDSVTLNSRAIRPYPPGRFRVDGQDYPEEIFTSAPTVSWAHRDRVQQTAGTLVPHSSGDIGPEAGTTYTVELYDESDNLIDTQSGLTGTSASVVLSTLPSNVATIMVWSSRDGYLSWQAVRHTFLFPFAALFVVLPLTYDEADYNNEMTWVRQGPGPHVTPDGFEGDGFQARMKSTTIPAWMDGAGDRTEIQATVKPYQERPRSTTTGDTVLYLGPDTAGIAPNPKFALRMLSEPQDATRRYLGFQTYTGSTQTLPLARPEWRHEFRFPVLTANGETVRPQALLFLDDDTAVITGHFNDTESRAYKVNINTGAVLASFTFGVGVHTHISSLAQNSSGDVWAIDYVGEHALQIDLDASFLAGTVDILADWNITNMTGPGSIDFITISATEYVLIGEYATSGTPYLYVIPITEMVDGATFALANRYKRFNMGQRNQGNTVHSGNLYVTKNRDTATSTLLGWVEQYNSVSTKITSDADGATWTPDAIFPGPSQYVEDLKFHPSTGHVWTSTEGFNSVVDHDGWLSYWSSPLDNSAVENTVNVLYDGAGSFVFKMNGKPFDTKSWTPTQGVAAVSVGGPSNQAAGNRNGYYAGFIRNIRFQNGPLSASEFAETREGSLFEPNSLTVYDLTMTNADFEAASTTGWTNETGGLAVRNVAAEQLPGSTNFAFAGANAQTIARQRLDVLSLTGLSGAQVDGNVGWAKIRWMMSSWRGQPTADDDPGYMGIRTLNSTPTQIALSTPGTLESAPFCLGTDTPAVWFWYHRSHDYTLDSGTRYVDAYYRADRAAGTNNDYRVDNISMKLYFKTSPGEGASLVGSYVPMGYDGSELFGKVLVDIGGGVIETHIWHSNDSGATYTTETEDVGFDVKGMVSGLGVYVAQGGPKGNWFGIAAAVDGAWTSYQKTTYPVAGFNGAATLGSLLFDGTQFVTSGSHGIIMTRTDVVDWAEVATHDLQDGYTINSMAWDGSNYYALVTDDLTGDKAVWKSADLETWTKKLDLTTSGYNYAKVKCLNSRVFLVGSKLVSGKPRPFVTNSTDGGDNWTEVSPSPTSTNPFAMTVTDMAYFNSNYVLFGANLEGYAATPGTWTLTEPTTIQNLVSPAQDGTALIAARFTGTTSVTDDLRRSTNGTSWSTVVP